MCFRFFNRQTQVTIISMEVSLISSNSTTTNCSIVDSETTPLNMFMEEVENYLTYKIASFLSLYWLPILVPTGLVGNTLCFLVMMKPNNREMSTCIYMAVISINDNMMMFLALLHYLLIAVKLHEYHPIECKVKAYLVSLVLQNSTFQILAMTLDKYIAIKWPHIAAVHSTAGRAKVIVSGVFVCVCIYNIPHLFLAKKIGKSCVGYAVGGVISRVYSWFTFVINAIIPFSMLIYMNYIIVKTVQRSRKMFKAGNKPLETNSEEQAVSKGMDTRQKNMRSAENQLNIILLLVTTLFLILLIPSNIRNIYISFVKSNTPSKYASSMLFFHTSHKLYTTNSGINFFLCCVSGHKFRNDLKDVVCGSRNSKHSSTLGRHDTLSNSSSLSIIS